MLIETIEHLVSLEGQNYVMVPLIAAGCSCLASVELFAQHLRPYTM